MPFVALSYEHKVSGMLEILGMSDRICDIENIYAPEFNVSSALEQVHALILSAKPNAIAKDHANAIAEQCLQKFVEHMCSITAVEN